MKTMRQEMLDFIKSVEKFYKRPAKINDIWLFYWRGRSIEFFSTQQRSRAKKIMKEIIGSEK